MKCLLIVALALPLCAAFAEEPELTPIDLSQLAADKAYASAEAYDKRSAKHAFDGSGLSADGKHGITANDTMYMMKNNNTGDFPWCIQVDLGEVKNLGAARIWNFNFASGSTKYTMRGIKNYKIYVSREANRKTSAADVIANYTLVTSGTLKEASGTDNEEGELIVFEQPVGARHFALVAEDDFDDAVTKLNYCGVAEIKLFTAPGNPEPEPDPEPEPEPEPEGDPAEGTDLFLEAEAFSSRGGWVVDPQFVEQMGSPYLLAHGRGIPCADATTTVTFPASGLVRAWVRTRDWAPDWDGEKPGRFKLAVGSHVFPKTLGVAPATWGWADAGVIAVEAGEQTVALKDLTGFEGRCDAIWFCPSSVTVAPPNGKDELAAWRAEKRGEVGDPTDVVEADLIVVGGGIAGTAAAIAAADAGLTVAIVQDRPMLGGNASDEVRVRTEKEGHEFHWIVKAIWNTSPNGNSMAKDDTNRATVVAGYPSIAPSCNYRAYGVVTDPKTKKILAVDARHTQTGVRRRFKGTYFVDTTGDGWIGYWAGARYMLGREAKETFDEPVHGQDKADTSTMGNSLLWTTKQGTTDYAFPSVPWATKVSGTRADTSGGWQWEAGLDPSEDTIDDAEMLRDRLFRAIYGSFSNTKAKEGNEKLVFNFFGHIAGKRESRRLVGEYVVREKDVINHKPFEDAIGIATWSVDLHRKDGDSGFIAATTHHRYGNWWMPYRSLYSKDIPNLFMAGRCASYSHVAFGSSRVMHAGGQQGVAVGYAAAVCKKYGCTPHQVYLSRSRFDELRSLINSRQDEKQMKPYVWPEPVVDQDVLVIVKDNDDASGVEISGAWATSSHNDSRIGKDYLHNNKFASDDLWVRYTPALPVATNYTVSIWWNGDSSRGSAVPIEIVYDGGTTTVTCDMSQDSQAWGVLGSWPFKAGTEGSVRILTTGQSGKTVIADAIKFAIVEKVPLETSRGMKISAR